LLMTKLLHGFRIAVYVRYVQLMFNNVCSTVGFPQHAFLQFHKFSRANASMYKLWICLNIWVNYPKIIVLCITGPSRFEECSCLLKDELYSSPFFPNRI
jgi:hypothetical protein